MLETQEDAFRLLNCLKCSAQAELFARESKKILTEYGSEVKREFQECLVISNILHDVKKIPRTTKQEIERLCQNKGEIKGTKKFLEIVFRYDKFVFYDFMEVVINNCQSFLFKKLFLAIQQKTSLFNDILPASQTSMSQQINSLFENFQTLEIDQRLVNHSDSTNNFSENRSIDNSFIPTISSGTNLHSIQLSNTRDIDNQLSTQNESDDRHFVSNPTSIDFDVREIHELRNIRNRVLQMYGSIEEFDRQFMNRSMQQRLIQEDMESEILPEAFSFTGGETQN